MKKYLLLALSLISVNCFSATATCHFADGVAIYQGKWKVLGGMGNAPFFKLTDRNNVHWLPWSLCEITE